MYGSVEESSALLGQPVPSSPVIGSGSVLWLRVITFLVLLVTFFIVVLVTLASKGSPLRWRSDEGVYIRSYSLNAYVRSNASVSNSTELILTSKETDVIVS